MFGVEDRDLIISRIRDESQDSRGNNILHQLVLEYDEDVFFPAINAAFDEGLNEKIKILLHASNDNGQTPIGILEAPRNEDVLGYLDVFELLTEPAIEKRVELSDMRQLAPDESAPSAQSYLTHKLLKPALHSLPAAQEALSSSSSASPRPQGNIKGIVTGWGSGTKGYFVDEQIEKALQRYKSLGAARLIAILKSGNLQMVRDSEGSAGFKKLEGVEGWEYKHFIDELKDLRVLAFEDINKNLCVYALTNHANIDKMPPVNRELKFIQLDTTTELNHIPNTVELAPQPPTPPKASKILPPKVAPKEVDHSNLDARTSRQVYSLDNFEYNVKHTAPGDLYKLILQPHVNNFLNDENTQVVYAHLSLHQRILIALTKLLDTRGVAIMSEDLIKAYLKLKYTYGEHSLDQRMSVLQDATLQGPFAELYPNRLNPYSLSICARQALPASPITPQPLQSFPAPVPKQVKRPVITQPAPQIEQQPAHLPVPLPSLKVIKAAKATTFLIEYHEGICLILNRTISDNIASKQYIMFPCAREGLLAAAYFIIQMYTSSYASGAKTDSMHFAVIETFRYLLPRAAPDVIEPYLENAFGASLMVGGIVGGGTQLLRNVMYIKVFPNLAAAMGFHMIPIGLTWSTGLVGAAVTGAATYGIIKLVSSEYLIATTLCSKIDSGVLLLDFSNGSVASRGEYIYVPIVVGISIGLLTWGLSFYFPVLAGLAIYASINAGYLTLSITESYHRHIKIVKEIFLCIKSDDLEALKEIAKFVPAHIFNTQLIDGKTFLELAIEHNAIEVFKWLLNEQKVDVNKLDGNGRSALAFTIERFDEKQIEYVMQLLQNGADPNKSKPIERAIFKDSTHYLMLLLSYGATIDDRMRSAEYPNLEVTFLDVAIIENKLAHALFLVVEGGADVSQMIYFVTSDTKPHDKKVFRAFPEFVKQLQLRYVQMIDEPIKMFCNLCAALKALNELNILLDEPEFKNQHNDWREVCSAAEFEKSGRIRTPKAIYENAAKAGDREAMFRLAGICKREGNIKDSVFWYEKAAEHGHVLATYVMFMRGHRSFNGIDTLHELANKGFARAGVMEARAKLFNYDLTDDSDAVKLLENLEPYCFLASMELARLQKCMKQFDDESNKVLKCYQSSLEVKLSSIHPAKEMRGLQPSLREKKEINELVNKVAQGQVSFEHAYIRGADLWRVFGIYLSASYLINVNIKSYEASNVYWAMKFLEMAYLTSFIPTIPEEHKTYFINPLRPDIDPSYLSVAIGEGDMVSVKQFLQKHPNYLKGWNSITYLLKAITAYNVYVFDFLLTQVDLHLLTQSDYPLLSVIVASVVNEQNIKPMKLKDDMLTLKLSEDDAIPYMASLLGALKKLDNSAQNSETLCVTVENNFGKIAELLVQYNIELNIDCHGFGVSILDELIATNKWSFAALFVANGVDLSKSVMFKALPSASEKFQSLHEHLTAYHAAHPEPEQTNNICKAFDLWHSRYSSVVLPDFCKNEQSFSNLVKPTGLCDSDVETGEQC